MQKKVNVSTRVLTHRAAGVVHVVADKHAVSRVVLQLRRRAHGGWPQQRLHIVHIRDLLQEHLARRVVVLAPEQA